MSRKRIICLVISLALIVASVLTISLGAFANDGNESGSYKYNGITKTLEIFSDDIMIDKTEENLDENPWYSYKNSVEHIVIHDGVTKISSYAFSKMDALEDIEISDSVEKIGNAAFAEAGLKEITISNNVNSIGDNAFGVGIDDFICNCESSSVAQKWCFKNYVMFNTPFENGSDVSKITNAGDMSFWSFVPKTDCQITFSSTGIYDTVGYVLDSATYVYSTNRSTIQKSAVAYNDDMNNDEMNFAIVSDLKAGKRYYLSAALKSINKTGSFDVQFSSSCTSHKYEITGIDINDLTGRKSFVSASCVGCDNQTSIDFGTAVTEKTDYCDVNCDGVVNAKDYAIIIHKFK